METFQIWLWQFADCCETISGSGGGPVFSCVDGYFDDRYFDTGYFDCKYWM